MTVTESLGVKPYYDDGKVVIYHADIREWPGPGAPSYAAMVTSPPYNVGLEYENHDDVMPWPEYEKLASAACQATADALIDTGRAWVNITPVVPESPLPPGGDSGRSSNPRVSLLSLWSNALELAGLGLWDYVAWTTPGRGPGCAWGSWATPSGPNMRGEWETVIAAYKGTWQRETPAEWHNWKDGEGDWIPLTTNVWRIQPEARGPGGHPAPFPVELAQRCIRLSTWPGETVFDPFMGSGSTLLAARSLGRRAVGVEVSERYCEIAAKRLAQGVLFGEAS